jgi:dihydrofolate synthase/folylpolyglutamate synthase
MRTGLYVSPHLVDPAERVRVAGAQVSHEEFTRAFDEVHDACGRLERAGRIDMHTTYFETLTAMGFLLFRAQRVEIAVVEVGMGGRLDATNVVDPVLSVITPVDFDHEKFLGHTVAEIAGEKAGIIKPGRPVVVASQHDEAWQVCSRVASERGAPLTDSRAWRIEDLDLHAHGSRFRLAGETSYDIELGLVGAHQVENARTAAAALSLLKVNREAVEAGLRSTCWPGRLEFARTVCDVLLDGAHNPAGASALAAYLDRFQRGRRILMIFAAMHDKDLHVLGRALFAFASELVFTAPDNPRSWQPEEMRHVTGRTDAHVIGKPAEALRWAESQARPEDLILITGSLYLVGELRGYLKS